MKRDTEARPTRHVDEPVADRRFGSGLEHLHGVREYSALDEVFLRSEIARIRELGYCGRVLGLNEGMAGLAVPILDRNGHAVAALSVGTLIDRLNAERSPIVAELLQREAAAIAAKISPFDVALRRPAQILAGGIA